MGGGKLTLHLIAERRRAVFSQRRALVLRVSTKRRKQCAALPAIDGDMLSIAVHVALSSLTIGKGTIFQLNNKINNDYFSFFIFRETTEGASFGFNRCA